MVTRVLSLDGKLSIFESPTASVLRDGAIAVGDVVCVQAEEGMFTYKSYTQKVSISKPGILLFQTTGVSESIKVSKGFKGTIIDFSAAFVSELDIKYAYLLREARTISSDEVNENEIAFLMSIQDCLCACISEEPENYAEIVLHLSKAMFLRFECHVCIKAQKEDLSRKESISERFLQLVARHCSQHRDLEFYANELCITPKYLSAVVSKATGKRSLHWIEEYVITHAKRLLKDTDMTVNQIADAMNFIAPSDFCRYFRIRTGMTPRKFRIS